MNGEHDLVVQDGDDDDGVVEGAAIRDAEQTTPFEAPAKIEESELTGDSYNLQQLKCFWRRASKADKKQFRLWIGEHPGTLTARRAALITKLATELWHIVHKQDLMVCIISARRKIDALCAITAKLKGESVRVNEVVEAPDAAAEDGGLCGAESTSSEQG